MDIREKNGEYELLVTWLGWEEDDVTWEPLKTLLKDVPEKVGDFLNTAGRRNIKRQVLRLLF